MELNVKNMPLNTIYRFDTNRYVLSTMLTETRGENYPLKEPTKFIEVFQIEDDGRLHRSASGTLVDNPDVYDFNHEFAIRDYDKDMVVSFKVSTHLEEVPIDELYDLRSAIEKNFKKSNK